MNTWRAFRAAVVFAFVSVALGACAGGMSSVAPRAVAKPAASVATATVTFSLRIPKVAPATNRRRPDYVSVGTNSASIGVATGGNASPIPATILNCTSGNTCTAQLTAPVASDTFTVSLYSGANATGSVLGIGSTTKTIVLDAANQVLVTLDGVVDSVSLAVNPSTLPAGTATAETVSVNALDAAGYTILAPGGYVDASGNTLTITVNRVDYGNGRGSTMLSAPLSGPMATAPGTTLTYAYDAGDVDETAYTTMTSSAIAGTQGEADVTYVPTYAKTFADTMYADDNFITPALDGNLWFTDFGSGTVGSIVPATGVMTHYAIPSSAANGSAEPEAIVAGPNNMIYFAEYHSNAIGAISTMTAASAGSSAPVTEFNLTTLNANPRGIAYDNVCDSNIWFTEFNGDKIGKLSTATFTVTEYAVPTTGAQPDQIACGDDGNFWFTEYHGDKIGQITPAGVVKEFALTSAGPHSPIGIAKGAEGSMWFTESMGNAIGRIATSKTVPTGSAVGTVTEFALPTIVSPYGTSRMPAIITGAPDGDLFFTEANSSSQSMGATIGRITTVSAAAPNQAPNVVTGYLLNAASIAPSGITTGPDGHIWYAEYAGSGIGYLVY